MWRRIWGIRRGKTGKSECRGAGGALWKSQGVAERERMGLYYELRCFYGAGHMVFDRNAET